MTGRPRFRAICALVLLALFTLGISAEAWARVGGGRTSGSSGSRTVTRPSGPTSSPTRPSQNFQQQARPTMPQSAPGGFMRSLAGGLLGGFLGAMLFRGVAGAGGAGGFGSAGLGLMDILLIGLLLYLGYRFFVKRRQRQEQAQGQTYYQDQASQWQDQADGQGYPPPPPPGHAPDPGQDLSEGLGHIRAMEPNFDPDFFRDRAMDAFFMLQAAHGQRDLASVRDLLTDEMWRVLSEDVARLKSQGRINRLENIAVRSVDMVQAWQEQGQDYIVVRYQANLLDYVVDDKSGQVLEGSNSQPVKFEEYWTFTRPVGPGPWRLSAITQPN